MIFMIRNNLFILFFIFSCSNVDLGYINLINDRFSKNRIDDLQPFYDTGYSFIKVTRGRNQAIFILGDYDNGVESWYGPQKEVIQTFKGLIIFTDKLPFNMRYHNVSLNKFPLSYKITGHTTLFNPRADYLETEFKKIKYEDHDKCEYDLVTYQRKISVIKDSENFSFCYNQSGDASYSIQKIHPRDQEIKINFYYQ